MRIIRKDLIDEIVVEINLYKKSDKRLNMKQREKMLKKVGLNFKKPQVIYLSGKISGDKNYKEKFEKYKKKFTAEGYIVLNPAILKQLVSIYDGLFKSFKKCRYNFFTR